MRNMTFPLLAFFSLLPFSAALADDNADTLERIRKKGSITFGYREAEPPFSYQTPSGEITGFSIDLCKRVAEDVKKHLKLDSLAIDYVMATPATRFILVKSGNIDIECAATTNNVERRKVVDFSFPNFLTATQFVSRREDGINSVADLAGRSVASASGTVNIDQLNQLNRERELNIAVIPTKTNEESFALVVSGRASAFVMDGILLAAMIADSKEPSRYALSSDVLSKPEPYGLMIKHGDTAFKTIVNNSLLATFKSGEINELYSKWFTSPIPPIGMNLNLPMSATLKEAYKNPVEFTE